MLNISKSPAIIFGCSALVAASLGSFAGSASAAQQFNNQNGERGAFLIAQNTTSTNSSNTTGTNVTTTTGGSIPQPLGPASVPPGITSQQAKLDNANTVLITAKAEVARLSNVPAPPDTTPVRYAVESVADLASCGCPDANAVASTPAPSPELVAAREAEAKAAAELAAAQAEARQFIESVKSSTTARTVDTSLW